MIKVKYLLKVAYTDTVTPIVVKHILRLVQNLKDLMKILVVNCIY